VSGGKLKITNLQAKKFRKRILLKIGALNRAPKLTSHNPFKKHKFKRKLQKDNPEKVSLSPNQQVYSNRNHLVSMPSLLKIPKS
jgi:hypothetical protein